MFFDFLNNNSFPVYLAQAGVLPVVQESCVWMCRTTSTATRTIHVKLAAAVQGIDSRMSTLAVEQSKQIFFLMLYFIRLKKSLVEKNV